MKNVIEYLEDSAKKYPAKTAVIDINGSCTYTELLEKAQSIGTNLISKIDRRDSVVCYTDKSINTLSAFFGIVYAGGFYTLLDPTFPKERVNQILTVLNPKVILTEHTYDEKLDNLGDFKNRVVFLEDITDAADKEVLYSRRKSAVDTDPLYCNFTSGSTGVPKGVLVCNRSVIDFIDVFTKTFNITQDDVIGNQAPFDFDVSVKDIYSAIKTGATLVILPKAYFMFPVKLVDMLDECKVTTIIWAVSALCMLIRLHGFKYKVPSCINKIMFSGEVMPIKQLNKLKGYYPNAMYVNLYGPTEITCNCTYHILDRDYEDDEKLPIGIPFENESVFLLDENDKQAAGDVVGEICVSGTALALGYYNNPEMTNKSFVQNPLNKMYPETIYRTGDLGYFKDGILYFSGRKDFQIKHMGHRIELEEIETLLGNVSGVVHDCCVYDTKRNKVVAFYVGDVDKVDIINSMKENIPDYMIPNVFKKMDELPLTKNGKTDRKLLNKMYMEGLLK